MTFKKTGQHGRCWNVSPQSARQAVETHVVLWAGLRWRMHFLLLGGGVATHPVLRGWPCPGGELQAQKRQGTSNSRGKGDAGPAPVSPSPCPVIPCRSQTSATSNMASLPWPACTQPGRNYSFSGQDCFALLFPCWTPHVASPLPGQETNGNRPSRGTPHRPKGENTSAPGPSLVRALAHMEAGPGA